MNDAKASLYIRYVLSKTDVGDTKEKKRKHNNMTNIRRDMREGAFFLNKKSVAFL